jgi:hypothetical protein
MSQLARKLRQKLVSEPDFLQHFPGDMSPDVAAPGIQSPYIVSTNADAEVEYNLAGNPVQIMETVVLEVVGGTRAQAESCLDWLRSKLKPPAWSTLPDDGWRVNYWRLRSYSDRAEIAVDGDDSSIRTVSLTVVGSVCQTN